MKAATLFAIATFLLATNGLLAQNPLRAQIPSQNPDQDIVNRFVQQPDSHSPPLRRYDNQVVPTVHSEVQLPRVEGAQAGYAGSHPIQGLRSATANEGKPLNFVERERLGEQAETTKNPPPQNLGQLIAKIGMNLAVVLMVAVGFVLAARQFTKSKLASATDSGNQVAAEIKQTIQLDARTTLQVVAWEQREILIARTLQSINAMVVLPPLFDQALEDMATVEEAPARSRTESLGLTAIRKFEAAKTGSAGIDEKLIQMLLENANRNSTRKS